MPPLSKHQLGKYPDKKSNRDYPLAPEEIDEQMPDSTEKLAQDVMYRNQFDSEAIWRRIYELESVFGKKTSPDNPGDCTNQIMRERTSISDDRPNGCRINTSSNKPDAPPAMHVLFLTLQDENEMIEKLLDTIQERLFAMDGVGPEISDILPPPVGDTYNGYLLDLAKQIYKTRNMRIRINQLARQLTTII